MPGKRVLYISGSLGLGHITRDLAIANELRRLNPEIEISWLAAHPANRVIEEAGENMLPEAARYVNLNLVAETASRGFKLNLIRYASGMLKQSRQNVEIFKQVTDGNRFDLVIGDETYEITLAFKRNPDLKTAPFVMIYDFVGFHAMTRNPLEMLGVYMLNRAWSKGYPRARPPFDLGLFVGELDDVPDEKFGFLLPNRREFARARYEFLGYVFPFDPADYVDQERIRTKLGYGREPLVVCSIGGTSIGRELLELCGQAFPLIRKSIPNLRMVLVCGPCLSAGSLKVPHEVEVREYVPSLHEHLAASSLAIVQGGGTTTLELTALRRPFIFFPIEGHCEQEIEVAGRLARHRAGIKMSYSQTTPELLARQVVANIGKEVDYAPVRTDGARRAAELIAGLLYNTIPSWGTRAKFAQF